MKTHKESNVWSVALIKRTERGWAGHFCASDYCNFRRNTLLECGETRLIVSTVGQYRPPPKEELETIGHKRYYETMVFRAKKKVHIGKRL